MIEESEVREYLIKKLTDILSIPTVNPPGRDYSVCANYIARELRSLGLDTSVIRIPDEYLDKHYPYAPQHRGYPRDIVFARLGEGEPILHFNGHYDVVPPGTGWTKDPFKPVIEGSRIYGRGATDMKGGIASILGFLKVVVEENLKFKGTLEVAFVPDEESGGDGTRYLVESGLTKPHYVIIGEPSTSKRVVIGHKGFIRGLVRVLGKQTHGSVPWYGENAFIKASQLTLRFMELYEPLLNSRTTSAPVRTPQEAHPSINLGGYAESTARKDNTVPGEFIFSFDRRVIPEENLDEVINELREYFAKAAADVKARYEVSVLSAVPPSLTPIESHIVNVASACAERIVGSKPKAELSSGRNDAVYYVSFTKSQVINFGPGVEWVAHAPDEYTEVDELVKFVRIYRCVAEEILMK